MINRCVVCRVNWYKTLATTTARKEIDKIGRRILSEGRSKIIVCAAHTEEFEELRRGFKMLRGQDRQADYERLQDCVQRFNEHAATILERGGNSLTLETDKKILEIYLNDIDRVQKRIQKRYGLKLNIDPFKVTRMKQLTKRARTMAKNMRKDFKYPEMRQVLEKHIKETRKKEDTLPKTAAITYVPTEYNAADYILPENEELP